MKNLMKILLLLIFILNISADETEDQNIEALKAPKSNEAAEKPTNNGTGSSAFGTIGRAITRLAAISSMIHGAGATAGNAVNSNVPKPRSYPGVWKPADRDFNLAHLNRFKPHYQTSLQPFPKSPNGQSGTKLASLSESSSSKSDKGNGGQGPAE
ncbi:hypothetical protein niasHT_014243 [Heterodera trifolii]|uniref:Uncharacterized protein n=1 Tax=Heterodera trifolii TaxID=157864 RepID=A0ABD2KX84_9BILA